MNIDKGLTNNLSLIKKNNKQYVRKQAIDVFSTFIKFNNLKKLTNSHAEVLSPESKYTNNEKYFYESLYLSDYVCFNEIEQKHRKKAIGLLASKINELHSLKATDLEPFNYRLELTKMFSLNSPNTQKKHQFWFNSMMDGINEMESIFEDKNKLVISHNDVVEGNILFSNKTESIHLIDFDSCSLNHPLFDIVSFLYENDLTDNERQYFCSFMHYDFMQDKELFKIMQKYQDALWFFWAQYCFHITSKKIYSDIAKIKKSRLEY